MFAGMSNNVGSVDGEKISVAEFTNQVTQLEDQQEQRSGQRPSGSQIYQVRDQAWNLMVAEKIFYKEANKLGIEFTVFTTRLSRSNNRKAGFGKSQRGFGQY